LKGKGRDAILGLAPLLIGIELLAALIYVPVALKGRADFRQFYTGGYLLRTGQELYNFTLQKQVEDKLVSPAHGFLAVNHPAAEYLIFVPLSAFSYRRAYNVFVAFNSALLAVCFLLLRNKVRDDWLLAASILGFPAVANTIWQGQDSIILLLLVVLAWRAGDGMLSGFMVGLGAFKLQLVLPVVVLYVLWRKWRFVGGFAISAALLSAISLALTGLHQAGYYIRSLVVSEQLTANMMPNLRGLIKTAGGQPWMVALGSVVLCYVCFRFGPSFQVAIYAGLLLGFHTLTHDLVLLLLPVVLNRRWVSFLAPVFGLLPGCTYLAGILVLADLLQLGNRTRNVVLEPAHSIAGTSPRGKTRFLAQHQLHGVHCMMKGMG
jgi:hypothetical protein